VLSRRAAIPPAVTLNPIDVHLKVR
jgi:hypothetical protein